MKISPVISMPNSYSNNKIKQNDTVVNSQEISSVNPNTYYGRDLVTFKSRPLPPKMLASKIGALISGAMTSIRSGDVLVLGNSMDTAKKSLEPVLSKLSLPIRGIAFCTCPDIEETVLFLKGYDRQSRVWNLADKPFYVNGVWGMEKNEAMWIEDGDHLSLGRTWVTFLSSNEEAVVELDDTNFSYINFQKDFDKLFLEHNKRMLATILGKDDAKKTTNTLSFDKIGGQNDVIKSLKRNILFPLKYPEAFKGFMMNRGAVLYGPPGTGKTLIAKTLGVESNASLFEMCATDMQDKYVGGSEKNCRELFQKAVDAQPSIIFLDEFEALGKTRGGQDVHGDKLLSQFLSLMSDLEKNNDRVYVIAATNRIEDIDPAILRSGRFALKLEVKQPNLDGTKQILEIHSKGKPMAEDLDYDAISKKMYAKKMSGADIAVTVKEAVSNAFERAGIYESMEEGRFSTAMLEFFRITMEDFEQAINAFSDGSKKRNPIGF